MRAGELLRAPVLDRDGRVKGVMIDIRARAVQEPTRSTVLVVDGLIVGRHRWRLFGYERHVEQAPALLRVLLSRVHRRTRYAHWADVDVVGGQVRLRRNWADLDPRIGIDS